MSTCSGAIFKPSLDGSMMVSSVISDNLACVIFFSSSIVSSICDTAYANALLVSVTASFTNSTSFSSFSAMACANPLVISLISIPASSSAFVTRAIIAPSFFSFATIPTTNFSLLIASTKTSACALPSSPFGFTSTSRSNPRDSFNNSLALSNSVAFFPPAIARTLLSVNINSVSGSSYENNHTCAATPLRYRKSSSLFAPVPTTSASAPPNASSPPSPRQHSYSLPTRLAHASPSISGAPMVHTPPPRARPRSVAPRGSNPITKNQIKSNRIEIESNRSIVRALARRPSVRIVVVVASSRGRSFVAVVAFPVAVCGFGTSSRRVVSRSDSWRRYTGDGTSTLRARTRPARVGYVTSHDSREGTHAARPRGDIGFRV